jgi:hypothetical protein
MKRLVIPVVVAVAIAGAFAALRSDGAAGSAPSPLAAYPGFGHAPMRDEARFRQEEVSRENLVAACMKERGFDYVASPSVVVEADLTKAELWALVEADPNRQYAKSLPPDRLTAYNLALAGVPDADNPGLARIGGCIGAAHRAIPGVFAAYGALLEPFERLQEQIASDRRVVAGERRWAACMAAHGVAVRTPRDLRASFDERRELGRSAADLARLKAEHARALAQGASCEESSELKAAVAVARFEHESEFVERYREVLERYRS